MLKKRRFVSLVYCSTASLRWSANAAWYWTSFSFLHLPLFSCTHFHCSVQTQCSLTLPLSDQPELLASPSILQRQAQTPVQWQFLYNRMDGLTSVFTPPFCLDFFFALEILAVSSAISTWDLSWLDTDWLHWAHLTLRRFSPLSDSYSIASWQCRQWRNVSSNLLLVTALGWSRVSGATFQTLLLFFSSFFCQLKLINSKN